MKREIESVRKKVKALTVLDTPDWTRGSGAVQENHKIGKERLFCLYEIFLCSCVKYIILRKNTLERLYDNIQNLKKEIKKKKIHPDVWRVIFSCLVFHTLQSGL